MCIGYSVISNDVAELPSELVPFDVLSPPTEQDVDTEPSAFVVVVVFCLQLSTADLDKAMNAMVIIIEITIEMIEMMMAASANPFLNPAFFDCERAITPIIRLISPPPSSDSTKPISPSVLPGSSVPGPCTACGEGEVGAGVENGDGAGPCGDADGIDSAWTGWTGGA